MTNESTNWPQIFSIDLDSLYFDLGKDILAHRRESAPSSKENVIQIAKDWLKEWMKEKREEISLKICADEKVKKLVMITSGASERRLLLAAAIVDVISSLVDGVPAATVTALVLKEGILTLCPELASTKGEDLVED